MARITTQEITEKKEWEDFVKTFDQANFLQSWYWGEFHRDIGNSVFYSGFYKNEKLIGIMLSIVENAKRGRYLTVPAGPLIDYHDNDVVKEFVNLVMKIAREEDCVFVRVRPPLISDDFSKDLFRQNGFRPAPMHLHAELTLQLDLNQNEDEILKQMRKTTRYEIKKAKEKCIRIEVSSSTNDIKDFYDLQIETSRRQGFVPFSYNFLHSQFEVFSKNNLALLYSAYHKKNLLAQAFVIFYGSEAVYHYGASTNKGREYPGAYLIQWEAILEAKKRGCSRYNFWGIAPSNEKEHRFYGVTIFKRGFGGCEVNYLHAQDLIINPLRYLFSSGVEYVRKKLRKV